MPVSRSLADLEGRLQSLECCLLGLGEARLGAFPCQSQASFCVQGGLAWTEGVREGAATKAGTHSGTWHKKLLISEFSIHQAHETHLQIK